MADGMTEILIKRLVVDQVERLDDGQRLRFSRPMDS